MSQSQCLSISCHSLVVRLAFNGFCNDSKPRVWQLVCEFVKLARGFVWGGVWGIWKLITKGKCMWKWLSLRWNQNTNMSHQLREEAWTAKSKSMRQRPTERSSNNCLIIVSEIMQALLWTKNDMLWYRTCGWQWNKYK